jgi:hypothetical protein
MSSKIGQSATFSTKGTVTKKENDREQSSVVLQMLNRARIWG